MLYQINFENNKIVSVKLIATETPKAYVSSDYKNFSERYLVVEANTEEEACIKATEIANKIR